MLQRKELSCPPLVLRVCFLSDAMNYSVVFEKITDREFPAGYYYAHIPSLGLTTHGLGIEGAREALRDLIQLWLAEKKARGEKIPPASECFFSTVEIPDDALQGS